MIRISQLRILVDKEMNQSHIDAKLKSKIKKKLGPKLSSKSGTEFSYKIIKRSIDARKKPEIYYVYEVEVSLNDKSERHHEEINYQFPFKADKDKELDKPVIIGSGPAGLFCGYILASAGYKPIILERGEVVEDRVITVKRFFDEGILEPESNVQFGEGGAGTFSDGKLNTQVKDKDGIKKAVLSIFVSAGAPEEIIYEQKPHLGTDKLVEIIKEIRKKIIEWGGEIRFGQKVTDILVEGGKIAGVIINEQERLSASQVVLAIGHSARDTFFSLYEAGLSMEAKPFAIGLRVEHPQAIINKAQYGAEAHELLGAAEYKLVSKQKDPAVFSFCMCPGGYIVNASSEPGRLNVNGMSYSDRSGTKANSAIVLSVEPDGNNPLSGIEYQRRLEEKAYEIGGGKIPVEYLGDFRRALLGYENAKNAKHSSSGCSMQALNSPYGDVMQPSTMGEWCFAPVHQIMDEKLNLAFLEAMEEFGKKISGFDAEETLIAGIESRTSSPLRIPRDSNFESNIKGLYPCGEGAGYAGGIISAAIDGIRIAEAVAKQLDI